ncbi:MAG: hypothetical protein J0H68_09545 [Sphingobacteriia bacterium]|nr:hypothetical protein [Sphingobacteriia bacterium]
MLEKVLKKSIKEGNIDYIRHYYKLSKLNCFKYRNYYPKKGYTTVLHLAARYNQIEVIRFYCQEMNIDINILDSNKENMLASAKKLSLVKELYNLEINIIALNKENKGIIETSLCQKNYRKAMFVTTIFYLVHNVNLPYLKNLWDQHFRKINFDEQKNHTILFYQKFFLNLEIVHRLNFNKTTKELISLNFNEIMKIAGKCYRNNIEKAVKIFIANRYLGNLMLLCSKDIYLKCFSKSMEIELPNEIVWTIASYLTSYSISWTELNRSYVEARKSSKIFKNNNIGLK